MSTSETAIERNNAQREPKGVLGDIAWAFRWFFGDESLLTSRTRVSKSERKQLGNLALAGRLVSPLVQTLVQDVAKSASSDVLNDRHARTDRVLAHDAATASGHQAVNTVLASILSEGLEFTDTTNGQRYVLQAAVTPVIEERSQDG